MVRFRQIWASRAMRAEKHASGEKVPGPGNNLPEFRYTEEYPADSRHTRRHGHCDRHGMPTSQTEIEAVLERIRPLMQADGGDIVLVNVSDRKAFVRLTGKCAGCPSSNLTLHIGIEMAIRDALPDFEELVIV